MSDSAPRRTRLAGERTQLAWWRTGLAAIAVGIGVGRALPALDPSVIEWPYVTLGVGFILYGIVLMKFGSRRGLEVYAAVSEQEQGEIDPVANRLISYAGILLGIATVVVITFAR